MSKSDIERTADEIVETLYHGTDGPKDAAMALLIAHVRMTQSEELGRDEVNGMLEEYVIMFKRAYFGGDQ
jgi:hypothetical protein